METQAQSCGSNVQRDGSRPYVGWLVRDEDTMQGFKSPARSPLKAKCRRATMLMVVGYA